MIRQEPVYIQAQLSCPMNIVSNPVNLSSDIDIFTTPTAMMTGTTYSGSSCVYAQSTLTASTYSGLSTSALTYCPSAYTCHVESNFYISIVKNGETQYSSSTFWSTTSFSGDMPSQTSYITAVKSSLENLGYDYTSTGLTLSLLRPYSANTVVINLCREIELGSPCPSTFCGPICYPVATFNYQSLTTGSTGVYVVDTYPYDVAIDVKFSGSSLSAFTGDRETNVFIEIYKFDTQSSTYHLPYQYRSQTYSISEMTGTTGLSGFQETLRIYGDGDYIIKPFYTSNVLTEIGEAQGIKINTRNYIHGNESGLYDRQSDGYFVVLSRPEEPLFSLARNVDSSVGALRVISYEIMSGNSGTTFYIGSNISTDVSVAHNGDVLTMNTDYILSAATIYAIKTMAVVLTVPAMSGDVLTFMFTTNKEQNRFKNDIIDVRSIIVSGASGNQGDNKIYYNTTTGKYEAYLDLTPVPGNDIYMTLNGMVLTNNIDYYQSDTIKNRIILEGEILFGDVMNVYYNSFPSVSGEIYGKSSEILWNVTNPPSNSDGYFTVEVSEDAYFTAITQSATTRYVPNQNEYSVTMSLSGSVGTEYYYRVKNTKEYLTMCGDKLITHSVSEKVPVTIINNIPNTY